MQKASVETCACGPQVCMAAAEWERKSPGLDSHTLLAIRTITYYYAYHPQAC